MKIKNVFLVLLAMTFIAGCKDDDDKNADEFSELTTEEHKANIEQSGMAVVDQLNGMSDLVAVDIAIDFMDLMEAENNEEYAVLTVLRPVTALKQGAGAAFDLKATNVDEQSLSQEFNDEAGIYEYNSMTGEFEMTEESTSEITYKFPAASSSNNNASISITNFDYVTTSNPDVVEISDELPESFDVAMSLNGAEIMVFEFRASYDADGIPTAVSENIVIEQYLISSSLSLSNSTIAFDQSFTYDGNNILSLHFESQGNFDYDNIRNNADDELYFYDQSIINSSNASISIGNLKVEGLVNWKGLADVEDNYSGIGSEQEYMEKQAEIMNKYASLFVKYHDNNQIIAASEFYATLEQVDYSDYEYWKVDMRMKFKDGSYMDDSFFSEENFTELIQDVEDLISEMETNYDINN